MMGIYNQSNQPTRADEIDAMFIGSFPASDHTAKRLMVVPIPAPQTEREPFLLNRPVNENDHIQGKDSAMVTLLMYGAYECPFCVEGNEIVKQIQGRYAGELRFVFRHFPRTNVHPHAEAAAEVAEAAGEQNKFWEMHDTLFENYNRLDGEHLLGYAEALRLDMARFGRVITGRVFAVRVQEDLISGYESGVSATPTYFINGIKHSGAGQYETLVDAIDSRIAELENARRHET